MKKTSLSNIGQDLKFLKDKIFISMFGSELLVSILQGLSKETYYRVGSRMLSEYEQLYISKLSEIISFYCSIDLGDVEKILEINVNDLKSVRENFLTGVLEDFQPTINYLKRRLVISTFEDLSILKSIIDSNTLYLTNTKTDMENPDFLNLIAESPTLLRSDLINHGLVPSRFWNMKYEPLQIGSKTGVFFYQDEKSSEGSEFYVNKDKVVHLLG